MLLAKQRVPHLDACRLIQCFVLDGCEDRVHDTDSRFSCFLCHPVRATANANPQAGRTRILLDVRMGRADYDVEFVRC